MKASNKAAAVAAPSTISLTDKRQSKVTKMIRTTLNYDGAIYSDERSEGRRYKIANPMSTVSVHSKKARIAELNKAIASKRIKAEAYLHTADNAWNNTICVRTF